ncbi:MAG: hypothetical protein DCF15_00355 [Phormidesmis priestleyi]|uniref:Histidine kinase n=1 Tax=Phormidesmis priestleyi TaxID=268141 RepID=A0A2W4XVG7_9CYAN|nr:MAG: hypothetical protein DCF15_00355 [Phormidesmis priestleyi]
MFQAAVGHGIDPDSIGAVEEALEQCQKTLGGNIPQAGIVMAAIDFEHEAIFKKIRESYPDIVLIGGTSIGEMSSAMAFQEDSLTMMLFFSDEVSFSTGVGYQTNEDSFGTASAAIADATKPNLEQPNLEQPEIKLCYAIGDGLLIDGVAMVNGIRSALGPTVPIIGGLSADAWQFKETYQFISTPSKTEVLQAAVVVLTFAGNLKVSYGVATGQRPIGPKATVTKSKGRTLCEVDGAPTVDFYVKTLGVSDVWLSGGGSWCGAIAVYEHNETDFYLRSPSSNRNSDGGITYFGHVAEQSTIQLTEADNESLLSATKEAFQKAQSAYPGTCPSAALMISCASRMKALGTRVKEEYQLVEQFLGPELPNMGFYAYGEISPFTGQTTTHFHNETFTALLLGTQ